MYAVARVNFLRAMMRRDRWKEEETLVAAEMEWTLRYFRHEANKWQDRANDSDHEGYKMYAFREADMWEALAEQAQKGEGQLPMLRAKMLAKFERDLANDNI